jgi:hypothetical protein
LHGAGTSLPVLPCGDLNDGQRLWNLAVRIPAAQRFSRVFRGAAS